MSSDEGASDSADSDTPAYVPTAAQKYGKNTTVVIKETLIEEHVSLDEDEEEVARREAALREEQRLQAEAEARAAAWAAGKREAAEARKKAEEQERATKLAQQQAEAAGADKSGAARPEAVGVDEDGIPIYAAHAIDKMETGQIVIQFLRVEGAKPGNLYLQAKLLAPLKHLLHETEVIKKTAPPDWSLYPPTIHNVKAAGHSILKVQLTKKNPVAGALDKIVGEVVIKVADMAPGVPYSRWYELGLKEKDQDKKFLQKYKGQLGKVQLNLLYFNINARFFGYEFTHPIHALIRKRYVDGVFHLIEKEKVVGDTQDKDGNTCLHCAAEADVPEVVPLLLQHNFSMKVVNNLDQTPLHLAAGHSAGVCRILLSKGANVHADDKTGNLPIHYAARLNNGDAVEALVKGGADPNAKNRDGEVPLVLAVKANAAKSVRALAAAGADPFLVDKDNECAADVFFSKKEKLGGGGQVTVADGAERQVSDEAANALLDAYNCDDPRELLMMRAGYKEKLRLIGSRVAHVFSTRTQQWTIHSTKPQKVQGIIQFAQSKGLQNEKIAFVVVSRPFPTVFRHVSPVQNVVCYSEEDPVTIELDPKLYYTFIPYTKHPDLKGDFAVILYAQAGDGLPEVVELREWPYGDQLEGEWKGPTAGGAQPNPNWEKNPRIALRVNRKRNDVQVAVMLQQPRLATDMIPFQVQQYAHHIGFYVYAGDKLIEKVCDSADSWINAREVWTYINIDGTKLPKLTIIPTTYQPGIEKAFTIKVMCNHKCRLNLVGPDGKDVVRDTPEKKETPSGKSSTTKKKKKGAAKSSPAAK